jgi:uncharacterized protein (DUF4415 family)
MKRKHDNMRDEYPAELVQLGVRGKHAAQYKQATNIVRIDPDLLEIFPDSEAVNRALRDYLTQRH